MAATNDPTFNTGVQHAAAVTPHNTNALAPASKWLWVGGAGTLKVDTTGGQTVTITLTAENIGYVPIQATRVYDTGTTATLIVAFW